MSVVLVSNDIHQTQISKRKRTCCVVKIVNHTPPSYAQSRGFIKVLNRRATEFDTRAKNWQGPEGLAL